MLVYSWKEHFLYFYYRQDEEERKAPTEVEEEYEEEYEEEEDEDEEERNTTRRKRNLISSTDGGEKKKLKTIGIVEPRVVVKIPWKRLRKEKSILQEEDVESSSGKESIQVEEEDCGKLKKKAQNGKLRILLPQESDEVGGHNEESHLDGGHLAASPCSSGF